MKSSITSERQVFELTQAPLMRTKIIKLGPSDHLLWLTFHHLVTDGWSVGVLLHELKQLYNAQCQGRDVAPARHAVFRVREVSERPFEA